ncbi:hypothetical protein QD357_30095 [Rhizobium sp. BR 317]|uniref:hypothetical protein n=1 Tax=Rhizobium sp. BR 317 TaxID=3040015 RepID=UPI0039BF211B
MEIILTAGLIAAGVISGLVLITAIIFLSFHWEKRARRRARSATSQEGILSGIQFERTEGGAWPTSQGDGGAHH